ncbi:MAG: hypothetical protein C0407_19265 [Desulfobacca sp.]|nr:hypothetical protein [Desulfobacca sp.]
MDKIRGWATVKPLLIKTARSLEYWIVGIKMISLCLRATYPWGKSATPNNRGDRQNFVDVCLLSDKILPLAR